MVDVERWPSSAKKYLYTLACVALGAPRCLSSENAPGPERSLEKNKCINLPMESGSL